MGEPINLFIKNAKKDEDTIFVEDAPHVPPTSAFVPDVQIESAGVDYIKEDPRTTFERLSEKASEFGGLRNVQDIVNFIDWGVKTLTPSNLANLALGRETSDKSPVFPQASYETMHPDQQKMYNMVSIAEVFVSKRGIEKFLGRGPKYGLDIWGNPMHRIEAMFNDPKKFSSEDASKLLKRELRDLTFKVEKEGVSDHQINELIEYWGKTHKKFKEMKDIVAYNKDPMDYPATKKTLEWFQKKKRVDDVMEAESKQLRLMEGTLDERTKAQEMLDFKKAKHQAKIAMEDTGKENPLFAKFMKTLKGEKTGLASVAPVLELEKPKKIEDNIIDYMQESDYFTF